MAKMTIEVEVSDAGAITVVVREEVGDFRCTSGCDPQNTRELAGYAAMAAATFMRQVAARELGLETSRG